MVESIRKAATQRVFVFGEVGGISTSGRGIRLDGAHLLPLVGAGIVFVDGVQQVATGRQASARTA